MREDAGRWQIVHRATGQCYEPPADEPAPARADLAYVGRRPWEAHGVAPMGTAMAAASAASAGTGGSERRQSSTPRITMATPK